MSNSTTTKGSAFGGMGTGQKLMHVGMDTISMGKTLTRYCLSNNSLATSGLHVIFSGEMDWRMRNRPTMEDAKRVAREYDEEELELSEVTLEDAEEDEEREDKEKADKKKQEKEQERLRKVRRAEKEAEIKIAAKIIYDQLTKDWVKKFQKRQEDSQVLFAYMVTNCHENLLQLMRANENWQTIDADENPEQLWKLIEFTCLNGAVIDATDSIKKARRQYDELMQRNNEWISDYRKRFMQVVNHLNSLTNNSYEEDEYTSKYIQSLSFRFKKFKEIYSAQVAFDDNSRYTSFDIAHLNITKVEAKMREGGFSGNENSSSKEKQSNDGVMFMGNKNCIKCTGKGHTVTTCPTADENLKKKIKCFACGGVGHKSSECVSKKVDGKSLVGTIGRNLVGKMIPKIRIILDDASDFSIVNDHNLLTHVEEIPEITIGGHVKGANLKVKMQGLLMGEIKVLYCEKAEENILSYNVLKDMGYRMFRVPDWGTRLVTHKHGVWDFTRKGNHLVMDVENKVQIDHNRFDELFQSGLHSAKQEYEEYRDEMNGKCLYQKSRPVQSYNAETVMENETKYTKREVAAAKLAIEFIRNSGFKSPVELSKRVNTITDAPIVSQDIARAMDIYGCVTTS